GSVTLGGTVTIDGDDGDDTIDVASVPVDTLLRAGPGDDTVLGGSGDDLIFGDAGDDIVMAGAGNDTVFGGLIADENGDGQINGLDFAVDITADADAIITAAGTIQHISDSGADNLHGEANDDLIFGGNEASFAKADQIFGGAGDDVLFAGAGDDVVLGDSATPGDAGDDLILGEDGDDRLDGGAGADDLRGGDGDDNLIGGLGVDQLRGEGGDDSLRWTRVVQFQNDEGVVVTVGNDSNDSFDGGPGDDAFFFSGDNTDETIEISTPAAGQVRVAWSPQPGSPTLDAAAVEQLVADLQAGADQVTVDDLEGAGLVKASINLGRDTFVEVNTLDILQQTHDAPQIVPVFDNFYGMVAAVGGSATVTITPPDATAATRVISHDGIHGGFVLTLASRSETQEIYRGDDDQGQFTLSLDGETTDPIAVDATASDVQSSLEMLTSVGAGNVAVSGTGLAGKPWVVRFRNQLANRDVSELTASSDTATVTVETTTEGSSDPVTSDPLVSQRVRELWHDGQRGTFELSFASETATLSFDATSADVKNALEGLSGIGTGNVEVDGSGTSDDPWVIRLVGGLDPLQVDNITVDFSLLQLSDGKSAPAATTARTLDPDAADVERALEVLTGADFDVTDTQGGAPWTVTFVDSDPVAISASIAGMLAADGTPASFTATTETEGVDTNNEEQQIWHDGLKGEFTLTFDGQAATLPFDVTTADLQDGLANLPNVGVGNVLVSGAGKSDNPWVIQFVGDLGNQDVPEITANFSNLLHQDDSPAVVSIQTTTPGNDTAVVEVQKFYHSPDATNGFFQLVFQGQ
ncbi:MAG: hypothetical protein JJ992_21145, partial [Planctomycetes bacterium]|nr:hypothetical protein [Planctomycetota bacterium]